MKKCKRGYYYCYTDKKCKRIPGGYRVTYGGYLRREKDSDNSETDDNKNNGNGSGNGNHSNGNGNGNGSSSNGGGNGGGGGVSEGWSAKYKRSIDCNNPKGFSQKAHCQGKEKMSEEKKDHEYSMARSQLKTIKNAASRLEKKMGKKGEGELKAWVQSKITKAADYIDTAADYVTNEETITEKRDGKSAKDKGYSLRDWFKGGGWKQAGGKYDGKPCAKQPGQTTKPYCRDADDRAAMSKDERDKRAAKKRREDPNPDRKGAAKIVTQKNSFEPEGNLVDEGKKDACYHKVKSRYSVWPSAYASGALVKCRKVGAANWGNKSKKNESYEFSNWRDDFQATEYESVDLISNEPLQPTQGLGSDMLGEAKSKAERLKEISKQLAGASKMHAKQSKAVAKCADELEEGSQLDEKCWKGYEKKGMKTMFGKRYPNCVKKKKTRKEEVELIDERSRLDGEKEQREYLKNRRDKEGGGKNPYQYIPVKQAKLQKEVKEDWQKSNRKDGVDGMSQSSVNAYKRENPGSKLKTAVTGKVKKGSKDAKRRKSFCSRSKGQKDMHNIDCSKTPDKKICKARKRWRC